MIPVVELLRVSTDMQASGQNIPAQHAVNERTCKQHGLEVVETIEVVVSGAEIARSPQMAYLLELISSGRARGVVLAEYSRLFRPDRWSDMIVLQTFFDFNANIYLPAGPLDLQNESGFVQATVYNLAAALDRRRIKERMQRGKEEVRRRGGNVHPIALPYGVTHTPENGWSYNDDIKTVREVFRLFLAGEHNMAALGRRVGIARTKALYILQNAIYTGWRVYDKKRDQSPRGVFEGKGYRRTTERAADEVIRVRLPLEPIISEETFAQVQALLAHRASTVRKPTVKDPLRFLYRGYAFCTCSSQLYGITASSYKKPYYMCKSQSHRRPADTEKCDNIYMERDKLEAQLDRVIRDQLLDPNVLAPAIESYNDSVMDDWQHMKPDHDAIRGKIVDLERKRARIIEAYIDGAIGGVERDQRLKVIDLELSTSRGMLGAIAEPPKVLTENQIRQLVVAFAEWAMISRGARRNVLDSLKPAFYVHQYAVQGVEIPVSLQAKAVREGRSLVAKNQFKQERSGLWVPLCA